MQLEIGFEQGWFLRYLKRWLLQLVRVESVLVEMEIIALGKLGAPYAYLSTYENADATVSANLNLFGCAYRIDFAVIKDITFVL